MIIGACRVTEPRKIQGCFYPKFMSISGSLHFTKMAEKFYLDSCIWRDYIENRSDRFRPLGEWAFSLIKNIIENEDIILYSDLVEEELEEGNINFKEISIIVPSKILIKKESSSEQFKEALQFSKNLKIPIKDALHAVLARDNNAILVSRDKHFYELQEQVIIKRPEDLI